MIELKFQIEREADRLRESIKDVEKQITDTKSKISEFQIQEALEKSKIADLEQLLEELDRTGVDLQLQLEQDERENKKLLEQAKELDELLAQQEADEEDEKNILKILLDRQQGNVLQ